jgi:hypothetical protein
LPDRFKNLIAAMENDIGSYFIMVEECIKEHVMKDRNIKIGDQTYDKIVLTPLIMDFGCQRVFYENIHYNRKPIRMPVVEQVIDIFNGIRRYKEKSRYDLLEIYPFMGINTKNYTLDKFRICLKPILADIQEKERTCLKIWVTLVGTHIL